MARGKQSSRRARSSGRRAYGGNQKGSTSVRAIVALILLIGLAGGAATFAFRVIFSQETFDTATLCPASGPSATTVMLLDLTDPLGPAQAARLGALLDHEIERAPEHAMISLGIVSHDPSAWGQRFARCKPPSPDTASAIYENAVLIGERFDREFLQPVEVEIASMMRSEEQSQSPIMEALQALLAETPHAFDEDRTLRIVLVSDLLQHSDVLSFYRGEGWEEFESAGGADRLAGTLTDARIEIIRIPRPGASADALAQIDPFWSRYFDRQGAAAPINVTNLGDL